MLLPSEYYEGSLLKETVTEPCKPSQQSGKCIDLLYPPMPSAAQAKVDEDHSFNKKVQDGTVSPLEQVYFSCFSALSTMLTAH